MFILITLAGSKFSRGTLPTMHSIYLYTAIYQGLNIFANSCIYIYIQLVEIFTWSYLSAPQDYLLKTLYSSSLANIHLSERTCGEIFYVVQKVDCPVSGWLNPIFAWAIPIKCFISHRPLSPADDRLVGRSGPPKKTTTNKTHLYEGDFKLINVCAEVTWRYWWNCSPTFTEIGYKKIKTEKSDLFLSSLSQKVGSVGRWEKGNTLSVGMALLAIDMQFTKHHRVGGR